MSVTVTALIRKSLEGKTHKNNKKWNFSITFDAFQKFEYLSYAISWLQRLKPFEQSLLILYVL